MARKRKAQPSSLTLAIDIVFTLLAGLFVISRFEKIEALILKPSPHIQATAAVGQTALEDSLRIEVSQSDQGGLIALHRLGEETRQIEFSGAEMAADSFARLDEWFTPLAGEQRRVALHVGVGVRWGVVAQLQDLCSARQLQPVWHMASEAGEL